MTSEPAPYPGLLLHRARIAAGVKLRAAARAAGCSHTLLSLIETGKRRICLADGRLNLEALLLVLHATPELRAALQRAEPVEIYWRRDRPWVQRERMKRSAQKLTPGSASRDSTEGAGL